MRKTTLFLACLLLLSTSLFAQEKDAKYAEPEQINVENADLAKLTDAFVINFKEKASLKIYGKIEMLTYFDTTSPYISDWFVYVLPNNTYDGRESSYSMSVRGSPLGFFFSMPKSIGGADLTAKLEMDFVGGFTTGGMATYSPLMRLKQAYVSIDNEHFGFLAGQSFGIFNPLFPDQASWIALGTSGNPWIRLPQLRLTTKYQPFKFEFSINRPMAANEAFGNQLDDIISDGEQSGLPFFMGRLGFEHEFPSVKLSTGASGVFGREKIARDVVINSVTYSLNKTLNVWLFGYDLKLVSKYLDFLAEFYYGNNLNSFFAGILQGMDVNTSTSTPHGIRDMGGWGQFTIKPNAKVYINLGAGIDKPRHEDLVLTTSRTSNLTIYGNVNYRFNKWFNAGLEPSYMRTGYKNGTTNYDVRALLRTSFIY